MAFDLDEEELRATRKINKADRNEIEVNKYVRTNKGNIGKVVEIRLGLNKDTELYQTIYILDNGLWTILDYIVKHSKQLIDLIEVGDIVKDKYNKYEVAFVKDDKIYCNDYNLDDSLITLREQDIKAILAKEQFDANCYEVGVEDE